MDNKTLLILAASFYQIDAIRTAKKLGYRVVTTDNIPSNPGHHFADVSYAVDTTDQEGVLEIARQECINGVIAPATDVAIPTAAYVAEQMGLPGPPLESVEIVCDKAKFRTFLKQNGFPVPQMMQVFEGSRPDPAFFKTGQCILKPDRSSGSKGTFIVTSPKEYFQRLPESLGFSPTGKAVLEKFIEGFQGTTEGVLKKGDLALTFFLDRQTFSPPYVTTCGHHVPTRLSKRLQQRVKEQLWEIWRLLKVVQGPFDCDFVATDDEVFILEVTPRLGGNSISRLLRYATKFDIIEYNISYACGEPGQLPTIVDLMPTAMVLLGVSESGSLYYDAAQAQALMLEPWMGKLDFDVAMGQPVQPFKNGRHRIGEAFVYGKNRNNLDAHVSELKRRLALKAVSK